MNEGRQRRTGLDRRQVIGIAAVVGYLALLMGVALVTYLGDLPQTNYIPISPLSISVQWGLKGGVLAVACWLALGDGHWLVRLATCVLALVWISIGWLAALKMARFEGPPIGSWGFYPLLHIPYLFVPTAVVLASARAACGLRFVGDSPQPLVAAPRQFTLSQVLLVVAGCAATLAAMRAVAPPDRDGLLWWWRTDFHQNAAVWCLIDAATSVPTALVLVFRARWWLVATIYFPVAATVGTLLGPNAWRRLDFYALLTMEHALISLAVLIWLFAALRWMGYRLQRSYTAGAASSSPPGAA